MLDAVLCILNVGVQWHVLPQCYPNYKIVHRRFRNSCCNVVFRYFYTDLANTLREEGGIDESGCYIDATFASDKGDDEAYDNVWLEPEFLNHRQHCSFF